MKQKIRLCFSDNMEFDLYIRNLSHRCFLLSDEMQWHITTHRNSRFCGLRKMLPKTFKWIKTTKQILSATEKNLELAANCAITQRINQDRAALFAFDVDGMGYIGEFSCRNVNNTYVLNAFYYNAKKAKKENLVGVCKRGMKIPDGVRTCVEQFIS